MGIDILVHAVDLGGGWLAEVVAIVHKVWAVSQERILVLPS